MVDALTVFGFGAGVNWIEQAVETAWVGGEIDPKKKLMRKAMVGLVELGTGLATMTALLKAETGEDSVFSVIAAGYLVSKVLGAFFWTKRAEWTGAGRNPEDPEL
jgi:hypothetical protein